MEMVLDDSVTPLNKEAADLGSAFAADLGPVEIQDSQTVLFMIQASFWRRLE